jgi:hypothetical protein
VACPNDPTTSRRPDVAGSKIDEVFIGSRMTNIGHFRAAKLLETSVMTLLGCSGCTTDQDGRQNSLTATTVCWARRVRDECLLLAVHGQPGAGQGRCHGVFHVDA